MNHENRIAVSKEDVEFLKDLSKTLNYNVRMIWEPFQTRQGTTVSPPTHVTFISEEQVFIDYVKFELDRYRHYIDSVSKSISSYRKM